MMQGENAIKTPADGPSRDEIARVAHAIWEAEGCPDGRDHDHWMRARQLIEEGRAEAEFPQAFADGGAEEGARPVQPGFEDVPPGMVPKIAKGAGAELRGEPGGRFAKQIADLPEGRGRRSGEGSNLQALPPGGADERPDVALETYRAKRDFSATASRREATAAARATPSSCRSTRRGGCTTICGWRSTAC